jgi:DNA repair protein RecO (recombination protein O)
VSRASKAKRELEGVVLHLRDYQDSHRIVEFFSLEEGRLFLIARGARASRKRFAGIVDRFCRLRVVASPGRELWTLHEAAPIELHLSLRQSLEAMNRANQIMEWCRLILAEREEAPVIYRYVTHALKLLCEGNLARAVGMYPRVLAEAGMMPEVGCCARCAGQVKGAPGALVPGVGMVCGGCCSGAPSLSAAALGVLRGDRCDELSVAEEVEQSLSGWLQNETGLPLRVVRL